MNYDKFFKFREYKRTELQFNIDAFAVDMSNRHKEIH